MEPQLSCERGAVPVGVPAMKGTGGGLIFEFRIIKIYFVNVQHAFLTYFLILWSRKLV